jgi:hypothetical protein
VLANVAQAQADSWAALLLASRDGDPERVLAALVAGADPRRTSRPRRCLAGHP